MAGKCRPSLLPKTLENVMRSNLSKTDKECIKAVFDKHRPKGRWVYDSCNMEWSCSECFEAAHVGLGTKYGYILSDYCPNCGATMMGGDGNDG